MGILENDVGALHGQLVDDTGNGLLIARDGLGAEYDRIARLNLDFFMDIRRNPGQGRHGLTLASGGNQNHLIVRIILHLLNIDQSLVRNIQISQLRRCGNHVDHTAALNDNLTAILVSGVDDLLYTVHV